MGAKGGAGVLMVVLTPVVIGSLMLWVLFFGGAQSAAACGVGAASSINITTIAATAQVGGYGRAQIVNAAYIANAAIALGLPSAAQILGVQTAIGESGLQVLDHGDAAGPDSRGLFQQRANGAWGTYADRMDPTISATNFFTALQNVAGWESLDPSLAINKVQRNANPDYYSKFRTDAISIIGFLTGMDTTALQGCSISGDAQSLATALVKDLDDGTLIMDPARGYSEQIRNVAHGTASADCGIDVRILQIITIALQHFTTVGISDLNRKCTGVLLGAGSESWHYKNGGGRAVDFDLLNGSSLTGGDANSMRLLSILDPLVPARSGLGQVNCRAATAFQHFLQFNDFCTHLHIDVGNATGPITVG